ncbi:MAG: peptidylprolyl isomerase [Eubacteriales bacterium]|nr:peptidylprolyl isomerase [Eubacteriales bacterium]
MDSGADIVLKLRPDAAPLSVANFQKLVGRGFYDNLIFHRVIDGFMIQGGDPEGTGRGGSKENIKGEFAANGVDNPLSHKRGVLSMARAQNPNSASSQFFICNGDSSFLDGNYAAFGEVLSGMEEVDRIAQLDKDANDRPVNPPHMQQVYFLVEAN